jgi:hypothetical protein
VFGRRSYNVNMRMLSNKNRVFLISKLKYSRENLKVSSELIVKNLRSWQL